MYFWGLNQGLDLIPLGVFHKSSTALGGPVNSLRVSFTIETPVPVGAQFELFMDVDATAVLEDSIFTNLPQFFDDKLPTCIFVQADKQIRC